MSSMAVSMTPPLDFSRLASKATDAVQAFLGGMRLFMDRHRDRTGRRMCRDHGFHGHRHHRQDRPTRWMQPQGMHHQRQAMQSVPVNLLANRQR